MARPVRQTPKLKLDQQAARERWKAICARARQQRYEADVIIMGPKKAKAAAAEKLAGILKAWPKVGSTRPAREKKELGSLDAPDEPEFTSMRGRARSGANSNGHTKAAPMTLLPKRARARLK